MLDPIPYTPPFQPYTIENNHGDFGPHNQNVSSSIVNVTGTDDSIAISSMDATPTIWFVNGTQSVSIKANLDKSVSVQNGENTGIKITENEVKKDGTHVYTVVMDGKKFKATVSTDLWAEVQPAYDSSDPTDNLTDVFLDPSKGSVDINPADIPRKGDFSLARYDSNTRASVYSTLYSPSGSESGALGPMDTWDSSSPLIK